MFRYFTLDNFDFKDKIVGIRIDINSPIINKKIILNKRITNSTISIKELINKKAKIVLLAHQGRKGNNDCISLKEHSKLLSKELGFKINFINEIYSKKVEKKIQELKSGQILLLENTRFYDDETNLKKKDNLILKLEKLFNFYIFDAFSVSHREQTSIIGFKNIINIAGRLMQKELEGLSKIEDLKKPKIFIFGGAKPDDLVELMDYSLKNNKVDLIILTGVIGEIALYLNGYNLGKKLNFLKNKGFLNSQEKIKKLILEYNDKIIIPKDVALFNSKKRIEIKIEDLNLEKNKKLLNSYLIEDIGSKTISNISLFLKSASSIYFKGPPGNFEKKEFEYGTKYLLKEIIKSNAFTYLGGGHSVTGASMFKVLDKFSYVSLAGGALVKFLSGKKLIGIVNLDNSFNKFEHLNEDFIVVGSNTIDTYITTPKYFSEINMGDKIKIEEDFKTVVGGGGINVSIAFSRLGCKVGYLGKFSKDNILMTKEILNKNKVSLIKTKISKRPCAKSIIVNTKDKDRIIFTYRGQNPYLELNDFDYKSFSAKNYYFNSLTHQSFETLIKLAKIIKKRNINAKICYNPSSYLIKKERLKLKFFVKYTNVLVLNLQEAQEFTQKEGITNCLKTIYNYGVKIVVITDSNRGSFCFDGKNEYFQKAILIKKTIETTGAGDSYAATFFYFIVKGFSIRKALSYAAKNASSVISKKGATDGLLYYDDIVKN